MTALVVALLLAVATWLVLRADGNRPDVLSAAPRPPAASGLVGGTAEARRPGRPRGSPVEAEAEALDLLDALAPALRAGLPPATALRLIASSPFSEGGTSSGPSGVSGGSLGGRGGSLGGRGGSRSGRGGSMRGGGGSMGGRGGTANALGLAAQRGEAIAPVWSAYAEALRSDDLRLVAAAWSLCETLGSPLAPTVATVSDVVRRRRSVRQRIAAVVAGPRATMGVLTALPLAGPFVAIAVGVSPGDLYTEPAGAMSLAVGLAVLLIGRLWAGRMIRAVTVESRRPKRHGAPGLRGRTMRPRSESS